VERVFSILVLFFFLALKADLYAIFPHSNLDHCRLTLLHLAEGTQNPASDFALIKKVLDSVEVYPLEDITVKNKAKSGVERTAQAKRIFDRVRIDIAKSKLDPLERLILQELSKQIDRGLKIKWIADSAAPSFASSALLVIGGSGSASRANMNIRQLFFHEAYHLFSFNHSKFGITTPLGMYRNDIAVTVLNEVQANYAATGSLEKAWAVTKKNYDEHTIRLLEFKIGGKLFGLSPEDQLKVFESEAAKDMLRYAALYKAAETKYGAEFKKKLDQNLAHYPQAKIFYEEWAEHAKQESVDPIEVCFVGFGSQVEGIQRQALNDLAALARAKPEETLRGIFDLETKSGADPDPKFVARALHSFPKDLVLRYLLQENVLKSNIGSSFVAIALAEFPVESKAYLKKLLETKRPGFGFLTDMRYEGLLKFLESPEGQNIPAQSF
jgi:hypothetical protein